MKQELAELFIPFDARHRPQLGTLALVLEQLINDHGDYHFRYAVALYIKLPNDKRKRAWAEVLSALSQDRWPWTYRDVTHYLPLDGGVYDDVLPHESLLLPDLKYPQLGDTNSRDLEQRRKAADR